MLTQQRRDLRPAFRPFVVSVGAIRPLTPHFTRVTFAADDLRGFGTDGLDQRIKLVFPLADGTLGALAEPAPSGDSADGGHSGGDWYQRWLALPDAQRNPIRTYTVREVRQGAGEVDVDFVVHPGDALGPAARWLERAAPGDRLVIIGPDALSLHSAGGIDWHPGTANVLLLAGDETAAPAICSIVSSLGDDVVAQAFIEVPSDADALPLQAPARCAIAWLGRGDAPRGALLDSAVRAWVRGHAALVSTAAAAGPQSLEDVDVDRETLWDAPDAPVHGGFYAWLAGEAGTIKALRRFLVSETGIDRSRVAFMGYWRLGRAEN